MSDSPKQHEQEISPEPTLGESGQANRTEGKSREVEEGKEEVKQSSRQEDLSASKSEEEKAEVHASTSKESTLIEKPKGEETTSDEVKGHGNVPEDAADTTANAVDKESGDADAPEQSTGSEAVPSNVSADPSPAVSLTALRPLSPSSRTSTPPLTASSAPAKKFSAMNVNKKFLSKTSSPGPSAATGAAKVNPLASRPISSPVPIAPSSRLLSTKLTTVSSSKPAATPQAPSSASTSSPWAKPSLPTPDSSNSGLHQPVPSKRGMPLLTNTSMGQAQGISSSKPAWRAMNADGRRPVMSLSGMSRDFPTASEVAEGKRAAASSAQAHAEAQAAQAEALLRGLNDFTHLEPNSHRWDDDDDEDDIIDFGDGGAAKSTQTSQPAPSRPDIPTDQPVTKSERFVEDFDRSWPRSAQAAAEERQPQRPIELRKRESDRVLFNASSNRLETPSARPAPPPQAPQPTKLMSRPEASSGDRGPPGRNISRQLPPHLAGAPDSGRALPPHMSAPSDQRSSNESAPGRTAWGSHRDQSRQITPHLPGRPELPPQSSAFDQSRSPANHTAGLPPRRSFSQTVAPPRPTAPPVEEKQQAPVPTPAPLVDSGESQAAEMHSAAEKARLRRQAEEEERRAAADRAKQKAKELELKFGSKTTKPPAESAAPVEKAPIVPVPSYTIAQRPRPQTEASQPESTTAQHAQQPSVTKALPSRPSVGDVNRPREDQWRAKPEASRPTHVAPVPPRVDQQGRADLSRNKHTRATAESFFEKTQAASPIDEEPVEGHKTSPVLHLPGVPVSEPPTGHDQSGKKDSMINDTLARIKAAMGERTEDGSEQNSGGSKARAPLPRQTQPVQPSKTEAPTQPAPTPAPLAPVSAFFDITEPELPRSPPPAWSTYVVKLPKESKHVPELTPSQRVALSRKIAAPRGWLMSYNPPLDLNPYTLSVTDLLLGPPNHHGPKRFGQKQDLVPHVSIPQHTYQPFVKGAKASGSASFARQNEHVPSGTPDDKPTRSTMHPVQPKSRAALADRWRIPEETSLVVPEPVATQNTLDLLDPPPPKSRSPFKPRPKSGASAKYDSMAIGVDNDSVEPDLKSGARFMVSSELEGDSLLDEVNKMSLDSVEETGAGNEVDGVGEKPRSPPIHGLPSASARTLPSSPNGLPPWTNQREHLKQVWEQSSGPEAKLPSATTSGTDSNPSSLYSSANAPSSNDTTNTLPVGYPGQAFSPTSAVFPGRHSAGPSYMNPQAHHSSENIAGLSYPSTSKHPAATANGYPSNGYAGMSQQGLWSAPAFGSSMAPSAYGYTSKPAQSPLDHKAAMAFSTAGGSTDMSQYGYSSIPSPQHYSRSPYGAFSPSYATHQSQQQQMHPHQQQRMVASPNGTYGYAGYHNTANPSGGRGASMSSRFAHSQANGGSGGEYASYSTEGQYYNSTGAGHGQSGPSGHNNGIYYTSGSAGPVDKSVGAQTGQGSSQTGADAGGGAAAAARGQRKMW